MISFSSVAAAARAMLLLPLFLSLLINYIIAIIRRWQGHKYSTNEC